MSLAVYGLAATIALAGCATPYGEPGLLGGAVEKQVSESTFSIRAGINGFSPGGLLKPLFVKRAREVGKARGYYSFAIESVGMNYDAPGSGYYAIGLVRFSQQRLVTEPGVTYVVESADPYRTTLDSAEASRFAKLRGSQKRGDRPAVLRFVPVFLDAVSATGNGHEATSFLNAGSHKFFVHYWVTPSLFSGMRGVLQGFVLLERPMEATKSYVVTGSYNDGTVELWLEEEATGLRVGRSEFIRLSAR